MTQPRTLNKAFSLIELLVVIAVLAILVGILLPSLSRAREYSYRARCQEHLRGLMQGHIMYASGNDDWLPGTGGAVANSANAGDVERDHVNLPWGVIGSHAVVPVQGDEDADLPAGLLWQFGVVRDPQMWLCPNTKAKSPGEFANYGWTEKQTIAFPYTYTYTYNCRALAMPQFDLLEWEELRDKSVMGQMYHGALATDMGPLGHVRGMRRLKTYPNPGRTILLAEEDTGWTGDDRPLNDPLFYDAEYLGHDADKTEDRHMGESMVGHLDGSVVGVPSHVRLCSEDPVYGYKYWPVRPDGVYRPGE